MQIQVSELIVKYMQRLGIEYIFGMPGAHILPVYDSLYDSDIKAILAKHEQGASFMAGGYMRASGKIGACITTAGPGATNLVTGIANAYADRQPLLIITGETSTHIFGKGGLQESSGEGGSIDQNALFKGITRYNKIVERTDYLANVLDRASHILLSPNPGPVLLSFPYNIQKERVDDSLLENIKITRNISIKPDNSRLVAALTELVLNAENPVIVAGFGCIKSGGQQVVSQLSEMMQIPVTTSLKAKGVIDEQSPYSLGSLGVTSYSKAYQYICEKSDLLIFLGSAFNERTSYLWDKNLMDNKKIAQVDINEEQLEKVFKADLAIYGDIKDVVSDLLQQLKAHAKPRKKPIDVCRAIKTLNQSDSGDEHDADVFQSRFPLVEQFFSRLEKTFPENIQIFDDNIIFAQNFFNVSTANRYYPNSGISSLGQAIPAAIGARFSEHKPTFAILGDGGFQMCCMEIMTAVNYSLPLNIVMFNNSTMGLIRKNQAQQYNNRYINCDFSNPDYETLAKSFTINYSRIAKESDLDEVFLNTDFSNAINLIEIMIDKNTFPNYISKR
ncbi:Acetolactate synthase large subunit [hydrothermal vent metagenome]|uniref:Acetolactate synthase large subunit n=1 Tax=hydrothermal vent metagenome TaxID=652676 RepID=A0A3B1BNV6_9ZZZZ